jgi:hypothetical protein
LAIGDGTLLTIAAAVIVASAIVPALVPAVRAVTRDSDGTITGPAPSRQMKEISS